MGHKPVSSQHSAHSHEQSNKPPSFKPPSISITSVIIKNISIRDAHFKEGSEKIQLTLAHHPRAPIWLTSILSNDKTSKGFYSSPVPISSFRRATNASSASIRAISSAGGSKSANTDCQIGVARSVALCAPFACHASKFDQSDKRGV